MSTVRHRQVALSADGRCVYLETYTDGTTRMVVAPEGASGTISFDECHEALYDRDGALIVEREPG